MSSHYSAVMFDLDGTLADTLADITNVGNHMLSHYGLPAIEQPRYRYLAGQGMEYLVAEALGPDHQQHLTEAVELAKAYQLQHGMDLAQPYQGIPQLLDELTRRKLKLAVLSNKPHPATEAMIGKLFGQWSFDAVWGKKPQFQPKPDPTSARAVADQLGIPVEQWLYLGDTRVDMETATAAGFCCVGVLWGFRDEPELRQSGADHIIKQPMDLIDVLDN